MPSSIVKMLLEAWGAAIGHPAFVTSTVEEITGTPALTFRNWATDHATEFCIPLTHPVLVENRHGSEI